MLSYVIQGESYYNTAQNAPNVGGLEQNWPQIDGTTSAPLLLWYNYKRILYVNSGGSPLWSPLAQLYPNLVLQTLSQPLLGNVIALLQQSPNTYPDTILATLLNRGF
jgi:hypothetical protein